MTVALGIASRMIMGKIGFSSSMRERTSRSEGWVPGCRFAALCWQLSTARAAIPENPTAASRDTRLHLSDSERSSVRHDMTREACMAVLHSEPDHYSRQDR
jgi:hypothetical protein